MSSEPPALAMVEEINSFIRYHLQDNSVYADKTVDNGAVIFKVGPFDVKAEAESLASDIRAAGENSVSVTVSR